MKQKLKTHKATAKRISVTGTLTKVDWINPHAWFHFSMTRPDGAVVKDVAVEWMGLAGLRQAGYSSADAFRILAHVARHRGFTPSIQDQPI